MTINKDHLDMGRLGRISGTPPREGEGTYLGIGIELPRVRVENMRPKRPYAFAPWFSSQRLGMTRPKRPESQRRLP